MCVCVCGGGGGGGGKGSTTEFLIDSPQICKDLQKQTQSSKKIAP